MEEVVRFVLNIYLPQRIQRFIMEISKSEKINERLQALSSL
jgi:hypothetical protein